MYLSTMGALVQSARHATIANNLANANSTGFKPDWTIYREVPAESVLQPGHRTEIDGVLEKTGGGVWLDRTVSDFQTGSFRTTDNPLNVALDDARQPDYTSFFLVRNEGADDISYTRDGNFTVASDGTLRTASGAQVLDGGGAPITFTTNSPVEIDEGGVIREVGTNAELGRLGVVRARTDTLATLHKLGDNEFQNEGNAVVFEPSQAILRSGALEDSATNSIMEMASMIEGHRTYDTNMKFLTMQDETLGQTVRRIAATA
jgi:flagellar basal-body rod protein FlgG